MILVLSALLTAQASDPTAGGLTVTGRVELHPKMLKLGALRVSACGATVAPDENLDFRLVTASSPCVIEAWVQLLDGRVAFGSYQTIGLGPPSGPLGPEIDGMVLGGPGKRDIMAFVEATAQAGRTVATLEAVCAANQFCPADELAIYRSQHAWMLDLLAQSSTPRWSPLTTDLDR